MFTCVLAEAAGLNGSYTIDPKGSGTKNYTTFKLAVKALKDSGVSGPVIFDAADGTYKEYFSIAKIKGSSATNTVIFESKSLDSSKVVILTNQVGDYVNRGYVVEFNGCKYVTFKALTLWNKVSLSSNVYGNVIQFSGNVQHINIERCHLMTTASKPLVPVYNFGNGISGNAASKDSFNSFINNQISGCYYGIDLESKADTLGEYGNVISQNTFDSFMKYGIYTFYQDSMMISKNKIITPDYGSGMNLNRTLASKTKTDTSFVINNFVLATLYGTAFYGVDNDMLNIYNNTFVNSSSSGAAFSVYSKYSPTSIRLINNIFYAQNNAQALNANSNGLTFSDKNCFFTKGSILNTYGATSCASLADWQANSYLDSHSVAANPNLKNVSSGDLHLTPASKALIHKALHLVSVVDDIDGDIRSISSPSIGADDVSPSINDASIASIDSASLMTGLCFGTKDIYVKIGNEGSNTISSVTVSWTLAGSVMKPFSWSGSLAPGSTTSLKIGSASYLSGVLTKIIAWTNNPNGTSDGNTTNDTNTTVSGGAMMGAYTIGGTSPNFASFREAIFSLNAVGVCGATTFNVRDGYYSESVKLNTVNGSNIFNTITFQSQSLDSSKVIVDTTFSGGTVTLSGISYVTFNEMTIINHSTTGPSYAVNLGSNTSNINFTNNLIKLPVNSYTIRYVFNNTACSYLLLKQNRMVGGYYSINTPGTATTILYDIAILNNILDSAYNTGIYPPYTDSLIIAGNKIFMPNANSKYGIYIYYTQLPTGNDSCYIVNNFITVLGTLANAMQVLLCPQMNVYYNTMYSTAANNETFYYYNLSPTCSYKFYNNIAYNAGKGFAIMKCCKGKTFSDFNDYYSTGSYFGYNSLYPFSGSTSCSTLKQWITASGLDSHSVNSKISFTNASINDLHIITRPSPIDNKGLNIPYTRYDIDGQARSSKPDIGADQFSKDSNDIGVATFVSPYYLECGSSSTLLGFKVSNYGYKDESTFNVHVDVSGIATGSKSISISNTLHGSLSTLPHDTIIYVSFSPALNTKAGGILNVKAYTDLSIDENHNNDTLVAQIVISPFPKASFYFSKPLGYCLGDNISLSDTTNKGRNYYLYYLSNSTGKIIDSSQYQNPVFSNINTAGQYRVWQSIKSAGGRCTDTISMPITISNSPKVYFRFNHHCSGDTVHFIDSSQAGSGSIISNSWNFGNGKTANIANPFTFYFKSKTYIITEKVTNTIGCKATDSMQYINDTVNAGFTSSTGSAGKLNFVANDSTGKNYSWDFGDKSVLGSGNKPTHTYNANGKYIVTLTATNLKGCSNSWSDSVNITGIITGFSENINGSCGLNVYPNPFQSLTTISYSLNTSDHIKMEVYDVLGRKIALLADEKQMAGLHKIEFKPQLNTGNTYILKMYFGDKIITKQLITVK